MDHSQPNAGLARLRPRRARAVLLGWLLLCAGLVAVTFSPLAAGDGGRVRGRRGDVDLYRAEIERVHAGEGYYRVAGEELRERGYPTASPFNWRFPAPMWLMGWMPSLVTGKVLLGMLAGLLLLWAFEAVARQREGRIGLPLATALLLTGPLMPCVLDDLFVMPVLWAGVLIGLSACAYGTNRPGWGVAFGLAAVFLRELAMPYVVVAAGIALANRRWREVAAWGAGLGLFALCYGLHLVHVSGLIRPDDAAHGQGWLQLGGAGFLVAAAQMSAYLVVLPPWVAAIYLGAALLGLAGWNTPLGQRIGLAVCLFLAAFAAVGHDFNQYWGSLFAPLLCFGAARCPASFVELCAAAFPPVAGRAESLV
jgi:hypothetical protein